jgi:hypothetical protein
MKKNRRDGPNQAIIHIYLEMPQGNSLCMYLKQVKLSFVCFTESENRKVEKVFTEGRLVLVGGRRL